MRLIKWYKPWLWLLFEQRWSIHAYFQLIATVLFSQDGTFEIRIIVIVLQVKYVGFPLSIVQRWWC